MACNRAVRCLALCHFRNNSCICLQFAVNEKIRIFLVCDSGGIDNLVDQRVLSRAFGRMRKHGDNRLCTDEFLETFRRAVRNGCKLLGIRILVQTGIRKQERAVLAVFAVRNIQNEESGDKLASGSGPENLQSRAECISRRMACTGNHSVCVIVLYHDNAKGKIIGKKNLTRLLRGHSFALRVS